MKKRNNKKAFDIVVGPQSHKKWDELSGKPYIKAQIGRLKIGNKLGDDSPHAIKRAIKKQLIWLLICTLITIMLIALATDIRA